MQTVTISEVNEWGVKPEGGGWVNYSQNYDGLKPLIVGCTYEVDIAIWRSKDGQKEKWYINKATPVGDSHAPPPAPSSLPPVVGPNPRVMAEVTMPPLVIPPLPPERDETRVSIERQVCLKAAVELSIANNQVGVYSPHDIVGDAAVFYAWTSGASLVEQAVAAGDGAIATRPEDDSRYGDPGPQQ